MVDQEPGANQNMKQFTSIEKIDTGILYALELTSSISVLLLAFGLIASMANVLTKGSVLTDNIFMQRVWAWTQCIAIDASVAGTIIRTFRYHAQGERVKYMMYGLLSVLLLFTAAIVSNIESMQQMLNITLEAAYVHVFIPVEALIWIRSVVIVLLIVAHALRHIQHEQDRATPVAVHAPQPTPLVLTPELLDSLRAALAQVTISEAPSTSQALPSPRGEQQANKDEQRANTAQEVAAACDYAQATDEGKQEMNNYERVKAYLAIHPQATDRAIADALTISTSTANKWRKRIERAGVPGERCEQCP
jgi:hypothetical protein